jgi:hypothetical protein
VEKNSPAYRQLRSLTLLCGCLALLFFLFFDQSKHQPVLASVNPFLDDPFDAVGSFGIQLALLAVLLSLARLFRPYPNGRLSNYAVLMVLRSDVVSLLSILVTLIADLVAVLRYPRVWIHTAHGILLVGLTCGLSTLTILANVLIHLFGLSFGFSYAVRPWKKFVIVSLVGLMVLAVYPTDWRQSLPGAIFTILVGITFLFLLVSAIAELIFPPVDLPPPVDLQPPEKVQPALRTANNDALDDLAAIYLWLRLHPGPAGFVFAWFEKIIAFGWVRAFLEWINPRKHAGRQAWNLVILVGLAMGIFFFLAEVRSEGAPGPQVILAVIAIFVSMEGVGVLTGYLLLNRYLGIFLA